jgi:hypothetical protein
MCPLERQWVPRGGSVLMAPRAVARLYQQACHNVHLQHKALVTQQHVHLLWACSAGSCWFVGLTGVRHDMVLGGHVLHRGVGAASGRLKPTCQSGCVDVYHSWDCAPTAGRVWRLTVGHSVTHMACPYRAAVPCIALRPRIDMMLHTACVCIWLRQHIMHLRCAGVCEEQCVGVHMQASDRCHLYTCGGV